MTAAPLQVAILDTPELGNRSYLVHNGSSAIVIDPQRDIDRVQAALDARRLSCRAVLETHIHNDYVTGGFELARHSDCPYVIHAADDVLFDRFAVGDGDEVDFDGISVTAIATPGHTDTHLAYLVNASAQPEHAAVFSGGSLLYGSVGRTDLLGPEHTEELTRQQYRSARRLGGLPAGTRLFPTHGFGSFCSSGQVAAVAEATIGEERRRNEALVARDEATFVAELLAKLGPYPTYYRHMAPRNRRGSRPVDLSAPPMFDEAMIRSASMGPGWVVDLRDRRAHARGHLPGSLGFELGSSFVTYLGWLAPWGFPLHLVGDTAEQILEARRQLIRIGIDDITGSFILDQDAVVGSTDSYDVATFAELARARDSGPAVVLDTRQVDEYDAEHLPGAVNIPLQQLPHRLHDVPAGSVWVHCASGFRASIAASLLSRAGRTVTLIDDHFGSAAALGLTTGVLVASGAEGCAQ